MADAVEAPGGDGGRVRPTARRYGPPDEVLVLRLADGDRTALGALYVRYGRAAYSLASRICVDPGLAEDVVQEVFLAVWSAPQRYDGARGAFLTWLLTLVHHKSVDAVRRESTFRRRTMPEAEEGWSPPPDPGADDAALGAVAAAQVRAALGTLPSEQRVTLALAYYGGYTQREVATLTGVPLGTVKSRMFNGVQRLRGLLVDHLREGAEGGAS